MMDILSRVTDNNSLILDFFAGSCTTGHAVMNLNAETNGNRHFILCTNNENGICENVSYKRLLTANQGYTRKSKCEEVLYEKKLTVANLTEVDEYLEDAKGVVEQNKDRHEKVVVTLVDNCIKVVASDSANTFVQGLPLNLKYYKADKIPKSKPEEDFYSVGEELEKHIKEMIQLDATKLRQLQMIQLEMLVEVDRICKKCGIKYNMIAGKVKLDIVWCKYNPIFFSFPTDEIASEFLTNFRKLIEQAGDLI